MNFDVLKVLGFTVVIAGLLFVIVGSIIVYRFDKRCAAENGVTVLTYAAALCVRKEALIDV